MLLGKWFGCTLGLDDHLKVGTVDDTGTIGCVLAAKCYGRIMMKDNRL